jgi:hypothetical protein
MNTKRAVAHSQNPAGQGLRSNTLDPVVQIQESK